MGYVLIGGSGNISEGGGGADVSQVTATASDVLQGKKIVNASGAIVQGTMPDNSNYQYAESMRYTNDSEPYYAFETIPEGYYHNTTGNTNHPEIRLQASTVQSFLNIPSVNIKPDGTYQGVGTATTNDVLQGKTFSNASGSGLSGGIEIKSPITKTLAAGENYIFPSGYYSGDSTITASGSGGMSGGTATPGRILDGYTAYVDNTLITGTLPDYSNQTVSAVSSWDSNNSRVQMKIPTSAFYSSYTSYLYSNGSDFGNATAGKVLTGSSFTSSSGLKIDGSMINRSGTSNAYGSYSSTLSYDSTNQRIRMTIPASAYYNTYNYLYSNGSNLGDATAGKVLDGNTFSSVNGINIAGTMENKGSTSQAATVSYDSSNSRIRMTIPSSGYYNTSSILYSAGSNFGDATPGKVLTGSSFTSSSGLKQNGTMPSYSAYTSSSNFVTSTWQSGIGGYVFATPNNAGYYSASTYIRVPVENLRAANIKKGVVVGGITGTFEGYVSDDYSIYDSGTTSAEVGNWNSSTLIPSGGSSYCSASVNFNTSNIQFDLTSRSADYSPSATIVSSNYMSQTNYAYLNVEFTVSSIAFNGGSSNYVQVGIKPRGASSYVNKAYYSGDLLSGKTYVYKVANPTSSTNTTIGVNIKVYGTSNATMTASIRITRIYYSNN